jgi:hypothetical protein
MVRDLPDGPAETKKLEYLYDLEDAIESLAEYRLARQRPTKN